jgi:hypothetical protein
MSPPYQCPAHSGAQLMIVRVSLARHSAACCLIASPPPLSSGEGQEWGCEPQLRPSPVHPVSGTMYARELFNR